MGRINMELRNGKDTHSLIEMIINAFTTSYTGDRDSYLHLTDEMKSFWGIQLNDDDWSHGYLEEELAYMTIDNYIRERLILKALESRDVSEQALVNFAANIYSKFSDFTLYDTKADNSGIILAIAVA